MPLAAAKPLSTDRFLVVSTEESAPKVFQRMADIAIDYMVVQEPGGSFVATLNAPEIYELYRRMGHSRFPGDLAPCELTIGQLLPLDMASDFYLIDLEHLHLRPDFILQGRLPRPVLIVENHEVMALIPQLQFRNWLEALKSTSPLPCWNHLKEISQTQTLPLHGREPLPRATL